MAVTLTPVESNHLAAIGYDSETETLRVQFVNGDTWDYAYVFDDLYQGLRTAGSIGAFFNNRIKPSYPGTLISKGTLAERVEIWLRSEVARDPDYVGYWVATDGKNVLGYSESETDLREQYKGDDSVVIVKLEEKASAA
jgi:hypothetical protein